MELSELAALARKNRRRREAAVALLLGCLVLALFLFLPLGAKDEPVAAAPQESVAPDAFANVPTLAKAAIVYDLSTGETLYAKNPDAQLPLASLTKLLTVYAALDALGPDAVVDIDPSAEAVDLPHGFSVGESFMLSDLARLTLTGSLNDGASAIAEAAALRKGISEKGMLAGAAASLGLSETYALNGSGLDVNTAVSGGYGSARDIAVLAGALVRKAPAVALATSEPSASAVSLGGRTHEVENTNPTVSYAPRLLLSKTGLTDLAGGNLAVVFDAGAGHPIAVVVMGSDEDARFTDTETLVAATLAHFSGVASL